LTTMKATHAKRAPKGHNSKSPLFNHEGRAFLLVTDADSGWKPKAIGITSSHALYRLLRHCSGNFPVHRLNAVVKGGGEA
jgi:hypothetical protein